MNSFRAFPDCMAPARAHTQTTNPAHAIPFGDGRAVCGAHISCTGVCHLRHWEDDTMSMNVCVSNEQASGGGRWGGRDVKYTPTNSRYRTQNGRRDMEDDSFEEEVGTQNV